MVGRHAQRQQLQETVVQRTGRMVLARVGCNHSSRQQPIRQLLTRSLPAIEVLLRQITTALQGIEQHEGFGLVARPDRRRNAVDQRRHDALRELDGVIAFWKDADPDLPLLVEAKQTRLRLVKGAAGGARTVMSAAAISSSIAVLPFSDLSAGKDQQGKLRVGAAVGVGEGTEERVEALAEAGDA